MSGTRFLRTVALGAAVWFGVIAAHPPPKVATVTVDKLAFGPEPVGLHVGDVVEWVNHDIFRHSATSGGRFDVDLMPGARGRAVMKQAGVVVYVCRYHPGMKGRIKVDP